MIRPAEDAGVGDPVHGRVEERAPGAAGALQPGQHPVQHVEEHENRAGEGAGEQLTQGEQAKRSPGYADRADDGDGVRRYRGTREDLARGGEQAVHGGPQHVQHGRPILPPG